MTLLFTFGAAWKYSDTFTDSACVVIKVVGSDIDINYVIINFTEKS